MPTFYAEHNLHRQFTAPQFTRFRHRFRGPRESEKINLEMGQLYYSIHKLYQIQEEFQTKFINRANFLLEGGDFSAYGEAIFPGPDTYPGSETFPSGNVLWGIEELAARIDALQRRLKVLEA